MAQLNITLNQEEILGLFSQDPGVPAEERKIAEQQKNLLAA